MSFKEISSEPLPSREKNILEYWKENDIFRKHVEKNENGPLFVFFEGPPTANGRPGIHHVLSRVFKDIYIRHRGLMGYHIPRQAGWDCHGLPVEREVEKKLGIETKIEIEEKYGLEKFNSLCRESVLQYVGDWNRFSERLGFWVDLDKAYFTMDSSFVESVWSLLKIIYEKGLMYQGYKVVPFDPVMGATMSDAEVALGYKTVEDPSLTVRFHPNDAGLAELGCILGPDADKIKNLPVSFLVWTTTPWTLPSNAALALHPEADYSFLKISAEKAQEAGASFTLNGDEILICADDLKESLFGDYKPEVIKKIKGKELKGISYTALFDWMPVSGEGVTLHRILTADFVTMDTGTGIVHIAPAYGADDLEVGKENNVPVIHAVGLDGKFAESTPLKGTFFKDADPQIIKELKIRGQVFRSLRYKHEYPFGWRTGAPLIYFAKDAWYIRTTDLREKLIENNNQINWVPDFIKHGRFGNWLENNRDWALSRERYWGTPLPVWTDGEGNFRIVGSLKELSDLCGKDVTSLDPHRPYIDEITFKDPDTGREMKRVPEVIDAWFDSGAMPFAQWGYPVKGEAEFKKYYPADFISEAIDQTRGWFYTLLAVSTMVTGQNPYKNVVCLGHVLDEKGEKMSKSKGNVVPPDAVFDSHGADAIRWYFLTGAPPGNSRRVGMPGSPGDPVAQVHGLFNMLQNSVNFFIMYAKVDGVTVSEDWLDHPVKGAPAFKDRPDMDRWILSYLQKLTDEVTEALNQYDAQKGGKLIEEFIDILSNWYIRRNRRRFWKGEPDADKLGAYDTLFRCLMTTARLMAPFTPFLSEQVFLALAGSVSREKSIHLCGWPASDKNFRDDSALREGDLVQQTASLGRAARMQSGHKVRQPLARMMIHVISDEDRKALLKNTEILCDELNVKKIEFLDDSAGILDYRIKPNLPLLGKRLGSKLKVIQAWFREADPAAVAAAVRAGRKVLIPDDGGENLELSPEEVILESVSREGTSGVEGNGMLVALDTELTEELIQEGYVRDLVRNIQELRKKSGLEITDRILLKIEGGSEKFREACRNFESYINEETLARTGEQGKGKPDGTMEIAADSEKAAVSIWKN